MATAMEVDSDEEKYLSVWEDLGQRLDNDMPPEDLQQAMQLLGDRLPAGFKPTLPSDVLQFLQNNNPEGRALSIMKHVLHTMDFHHEGNRTWSYKALFEKFEIKLKAFDKNENFVGRQVELNEILKMFSPSSNILGYWIYGRSGMGKTTLADEVCWNVYATGAMTLIRLNLSETTNFTDMLMEFQRGMGNCLFNESERNPVHYVLNLVQEIKKDTLIFFDNIDEVYRQDREDLESFIPELIKQLKNSKFEIRTIFTSRVPLEKGTLEELRTLYLQELSREDSKKLLRLLSNKDSTDESQIDEIVDKTILSPQKLAFRHHALSLPPALFSNFSIHVDRDVLNAFLHLNDTRQKDLAKLMIFDTSSFDDDDAGAALDKSINEVVQSLLDLTGCYLIQDIRHSANAGETEWDMRMAHCIHPDVFSSLKKICHDNKDLTRCRVEAHRRFSQTTVERMERECKDFDMFYEKAVRFARQSTNRMKVLFNFLSENHLDMSYEQFNCLKCIPPLTFTFQRRHDIIKKVAIPCKTEGNDTLYWSWLLEEAKIFLEVKEFKKADEKLEEVVKTGLLTITPSSRTIAILQAEYNLTKGRTLRGLEQYKDAMEKQMAALELLEKWATDDIPRKAAVCNAIGNIYHDSEEYEKSGRYHRQAVDIMKEYVKEGLTFDMSVYLFNVGTIFYAKADQIKLSHKDKANELLEKALKYYKESIEFDIKWKLNGMNGHSDKLKIRARAFKALEQFDKAIKDVRESVKLKEKLFPNGPWSGLILGYYQIAALFVKKRQALLKPNGKEVQGSAHTSGTGTELLKKSWKWLNKAAYLIKEKRQDGLSPKDVESRCFSDLYKEVAYCLSDSLGKDAELFCSAFEAGDFMRERQSSSDDDSSNDSADDDDDEMHQSSGHDSGMDDNISEMNSAQNEEVPRAEQISGSGNDGVFEPDNEAMATSSSHKRKLSN